MAKDTNEPLTLPDFPRWFVESARDMAFATSRHCWLAADEDGATRADKKKLRIEARQWNEQGERLDAILDGAA